MRVFLNPGHAPNGNPDPGACGFGLRECDVAKNVADLVAGYLAVWRVISLPQVLRWSEICNPTAYTKWSRLPTAAVRTYSSPSTVMLVMEWRRGLRRGTSTEAGQERHWQAAFRTRLSHHSELRIAEQRERSPVSTVCMF